jgi:hypothetical protein
VLPGGAPPMKGAAPPIPGARDTQADMQRASVPAAGIAGIQAGIPAGIASQNVYPGGQPYGMDAKSAYAAKRAQDKKDEEAMMGLPNQPSSRPCISCVPKGTPPTQRVRT